MQILLGLFQLAVAQGQLQENRAGVVGLGTVAPALDHPLGQGLHAIDRRLPRLIRRTMQQCLAGRQPDPGRLAGCGRIARGLGQRFA